MLSFDYAQDLPSLKRLITLSNRAQWTNEDINWARPLSKRGGEYEAILEWHGMYRNPYIQALGSTQRENLARQMVAREFSQILHGEQAGMMLAGQLTCSVRDLDARIFAANQARDEARHVQAVRELVQRIGPIYPCSRLLEANMEMLLSCEHWPKQVLGLQLFLEARALLTFRQTLMFVRDPVFQDVTARIERDEANHVAFGIQYLRTGIEDLSPEGRAELVAYAQHLNDTMWVMMEQSDFRASFEEVDLDFDECLAHQGASFMAPSMGLVKSATIESMHEQFQRWFVGALKRVGLGDALAEAQAVEAQPEGEPEDSVEKVLPWLAPAAPQP